MGGRNAYIQSERVRPSLEERVLATLRSSCLTTRQIAERAGRSESAVKTALAALETKGQVTCIKDHSPRGWKVTKEPG